MRAEILIACRGELPENLARTLDSLEETIGPEDAVRVLLDGRQAHEYRSVRCAIEQPWDRPRGCGQVRHYGISTSPAAVCVLVDGHMRFPAGWLDAVCDHLDGPEHCCDLTCCHMRSLDRSWQPIAGQHYAGAWIAIKTREVGNQHWPIAAKWNERDAVTGDIGAVMGACYGIRRRWYERLGGPLSILEAWGQDEEVLSLAVRLAGGRVWLLEPTIEHVYAAPAVRHVSNQAIETADVWANRYAVIDALPMSDGLRADLCGWLRLNGLPHEIVDVRRGLRAQRASAVNAALRSLTSSTLDDLIADGSIRRLTDAEQEYALKRTLKEDDMKRRCKTAQIPTQTTMTTLARPPAPTERPTERAQIVLRKVERCERCDTINPFRQNCGMRDMGAFRQAHGRCYHCGHKAQIRQV